MQGFQRDRAINRIVMLIDESQDQWRKAGFYGDPDVQKIMDSLYDRWEKSGQKGIPLEHATDNELLVLLNKAEHYSKASPAEIQRRMLLEETMGHRKKEGIISKIKRLFSR